MQKYRQKVRESGSLLCVGLDSDLTKLPERFRAESQPQFAFNRWIIEQTHSFVSAFKPNLAFYEARGEAGWKELRLTMQYLREHHPDIFTIADAKRGDIDSTNAGYVSSIFDELGFDAITLHPYLGKEALTPFLERSDKVSILLCRTSNPGAGEVQDLLVQNAGSGQQEPLWKYLARQVATQWNGHDNCILVTGATYPEELGEIRQVVGEEMPFLVPGIGAQGGDLEATLRAGLNSQGEGLLISSSRGVIFAEDPGEAARQLLQGIQNSISALSTRPATIEK